MIDFLVGFSYGIVLLFGAGLSAVVVLAVYFWLAGGVRKRRVVRR